MLRIRLLVILLGISLVGCAAEAELGDMEMELAEVEQAVLDLNNFVEISSNYLSSVEGEAVYQFAQEGGYCVVSTEFMVPKDITEAEIAAHVDYIIEKKRNQYSDVFVIIICYYDDEIYKKYGDDSVATVLWGPNGCTYNRDGLKIGDYSQHTISLEFHPLRLEFELTEREKLLYDELQSYALVKIGDIVYPHSAFGELQVIDEIYREVAELQGVTCEEVVEVREKVTWRRFEEISENNYVE